MYIRNFLLELEQVLCVKHLAKIWKSDKTISEFFIVSRIGRVIKPLFKDILPNSTLREKCSYSEFFWPAYSYIRTEYGEINFISLHSDRMRGNTDQKNSEHGHFSRSDNYQILLSLEG